MKIGNLFYAEQDEIFFAFCLEEENAVDKYCKEIQENTKQFAIMTGADEEHTQTFVQRPEENSGQKKTRWKKQMRYFWTPASGRKIPKGTIEVTGNFHEFYLGR